MRYWFSDNQKTVAFTALIAVAFGAAFYFYHQNRKAVYLLQNPKAATEKEKKEIVDKVSVFMELPTGEDPSLVTVVDEEKVKDQPFFAKSKSGDKVLIYAKAKEAIIYRPESNKIIKVGPIDTTSEEESAIYKVSLYSTMSDIVSLASVQNNLQKKMSNLEFLIKGTTTLQTYTEDIVVDLTGNNSDIARQIAENIGASVSSFPKGETKPDDADFMIIIAGG